MVDKRTIHGPRMESPVPCISLGSHYVQCLTKHGEQVAQVQRVNGKVETRTFADLLRYGRKVGKFLREKGIVSGDTVFVCSANNLDFTPVLLGTLFIGAAVAPVLPYNDSSDLLHLLEVIKPQLVIYHPEAKDALSIAMAQSTKQVEMVPFASIVERFQTKELITDFEMYHVTDPANHVALVMCSSGTSGKPKGVEISHTAVLHQANFPFYYSSEADEASIGQKVVMNLSNPNWGTAQMSFIVAMTKGMKLVLLEKFTEEEFMKTVQELKVNYLMLKPFEVISLAKWADTEKYDTSSLKYITYGGSTISYSMVEMAQKRLKTKIVTIYGMTETLGVARPPYGITNERHLSLGTLYDGAEGKVVDPETGKKLEPNCEGELCLRSPSLFKQYRNNPEATQNSIDDEGFYHTGDVVRYDEDGYIYFLDRIKELIKYKQHQQISAIDIEEVLLCHPSVLEASVVGIPHELDYEHATAFVVRRPGSDVTAQELTALVEGKLPWYKWLPGGVNFIESLPKTASGKILKRHLRALAVKGTK